MVEKTDVLTVLLYLYSQDYPILYLYVKEMTRITIKFKQFNCNLIFVMSKSKQSQIRL